MLFSFEAMTADGALVRETLEAPSKADVAAQLRARGYVLLRLSAVAPEPADAAASRSAGWFSRRGMNSRDLMLFTRQVHMLLSAGSAVVPALEAIEQQTTRPAMQRLVREIREHVEQGGNLSEAFRNHPQVFKPAYCSMVAAGEAAGALPDAFRRLAELTHRQQQTRKMLIGALTYPIILLHLCVSVAAVMLGFVVPRFRGLFEALNADLPATTQFMFDLSEQLRDHWPYVVAVLVALIVAAVLVLRLEATRRWLNLRVLRLPLVGRLVARLQLGRLLTTWTAMLRCHVPLLETIQISRSVTRSANIAGLLDAIEESVSSGGHVSDAMQQAGWIEPIIVAAIRTGENNGQLTESVEFVADWLDEDNAHLMRSAMRLAEPALLAVMGTIVAFVAMSLFLPLFDLATAGGAH